MAVHEPGDHAPAADVHPLVGAGAPPAGPTHTTRPSVDHQGRVLDLLPLRITGVEQTDSIEKVLVIVHHSSPLPLRR